MLDDGGRQRPVPRLARVDVVQHDQRTRQGRAAQVRVLLDAHGVEDLLLRRDDDRRQHVAPGPVGQPAAPGLDIPRQPPDDRHAGQEGLHVRVGVQHRGARAAADDDVVDHALPDERQAVLDRLARLARSHAILEDRHRRRLGCLDLALGPRPVDTSSIDAKVVEARGRQPLQGALVHGAPVEPIAQLRRQRHRAGEEAPGRVLPQARPGAGVRETLF